MPVSGLSKLWPTFGEFSNPDPVKQPQRVVSKLLDGQPADYWKGAIYYGLHYGAYSAQTGVIESSKAGELTVGDRTPTWWSVDPVTFRTRSRPSPERSGGMACHYRVLRSTAPELPPAWRASPRPATVGGCQRSSALHAVVDFPVTYEVPAIRFVTAQYKPPPGRGTSFVPTATMSPSVVVMAAPTCRCSDADRTRRTSCDIHSVLVAGRRLKVVAEQQIDNPRHGGETIWSLASRNMSASGKTFRTLCQRSPDSASSR